MDIHWECPQCHCDTNDVNDEFETFSQLCDDCGAECAVDLDIKIKSVKVLIAGTGL